MEWGCPHCGASLSIADTKLGPEWSFARCYRCGKDSLIRRQAVQVLKVDAAPAGTELLLPNDPRSMSHPPQSKKAPSPKPKTVEIRKPPNMLWSLIPIGLGVALIVSGATVIRKTADLAQRVEPIAVTVAHSKNHIDEAPKIPTPTENIDTIETKIAAPIRARSKTYLRTGPGSTYPIIETLLQSEAASIVERRGKWVRIQKGERMGWVTSDDVALDSVSTTSAQ